MKMFNKTLVAGAILAFAAFGSASADEGLSFTNEISTDTYYMGDVRHFTNTGDDNDYHRFPGITEKMTAEYLGDRVDAKVELSFTFYGYNNNAYDSDRLRYEKRSIVGLSDIDFDGYIKFRPIEILQLAINAREYASGSYFPILDKKIGLGNYTGGFGLLIKPMEGLSIGAGVTLGTILFSDFDDDDYYYYAGDYTDYDPDKIYLNFGAEYAFEGIGSFALTFNNVVNNFGFGAYAKVTAVNALDIYTGISFQKKQGAFIAGNPLTLRAYLDTDSKTNKITYYYQYAVRGNVIFNAAAEYKGIDKLYLAGELATNFMAEADGARDFYTGLKATYEINDMFSVGGTSYMAFDFVDSRDDEDHNYCYSPFISFCPEVILKVGNNTFKAGFCMEFEKTYETWKDTERKNLFLGSIPLSWTYAF